MYRQTEMTAEHQEQVRTLCDAIGREDCARTMSNLSPFTKGSLFVFQQNEHFHEHFHEHIRS